MPLRVLAIAATAITAALLAVTPVSAAITRYTAPGANGPEPCTETAPCSIHNAIQNASAGDSVVIKPGEYGTPAAPLSQITASVKLSISGVLGQPRPIIHANDTVGLRMGQVESTLRWVEVRNAGVTAALALQGALAEQVVGHSTRVNGYGCVVQKGTLKNSTCSASAAGGKGLGSGLSGAGGAAQVQPTVTLRGVTAWASGANSYGIELDARQSIQHTYKVTNTIAQGTLQDVRAATDGAANSRARIEIQDSNFDAAQQSGAGATVVQGANNITAPPLLVNPNAGDFRQLAGSPTIDKGANLVDNGAEDFEGTPRLINSTDIGADEYVPPPAVNTDAFGSITRTGARVLGRVTPNSSPTSYRFEYGTTTDYGLSTAPQDAGSGLDAVAVFADLTGLTPGVLYHFRLVATNASGTSAGADMTFTTEAVPPPVVGSIKLTSKVFRLGGKLPALIGAQKKAPVGTIVRFNLNESANAKVSFRKLVGGRLVGGKCRAPSRANRGRPRCTRKVKVKGSISFLAKPGLNQLRFHGRIDAKRKLGLGRYEIAVVATDAFGRIAPAKRASFRIVR